jgi:hypothetical protein
MMLRETAAMTRALARANSGPPGDFPFQTTQSADGLIYLHSYGQYPSFGSDFLNIVQQALSQRVQPRLGYGLRARVDIYAYNSRADFLAGAQPVSPDITGAYSNFAPSQVYLPLYYDAADTFDLVAHEMTHITFHQSVDVGHLNWDFREFPIWFDEGLAVSDESTTSPGYGVYRTQLIQSVRNGGRYIDIFNQFVWSYPQDPATDDLSYAEAGAFVEYLATTLGADRFHQFIADAATGDLNSACIMDFGADLPTLQSQWEVSLGKPALQHAAGIAPSQTTVTPYYPAHEPSLAARTRPYGVGGGDDALVMALSEAGAGTGIALLALGIGALWLRRRRRHWRALRSAPPLVGAPPVVAKTPPDAAIAPGALVTDAPTLRTTDAPAASEPTASAPTAPAMPAIDTSKPPLGTPWLEQVALVLGAPLALGTGMLWLLLEPARLWRHAALAGAVAALLLAIGIGVFGWRARRGHRNFVAHAITGVALLALAALAVTQTAGQAGTAQAQGYEHDGAHALALAAYSDAGASTAALTRVHTAWADAAYYSSSDYPVATAQYRLAIALAGPGKASSENRAALLKLTLEWGKRLSDAHQYQQAAQVYASQFASPSCASDCRASVQEQGSDVYLAWAADLIARKQPDAALAQLKALERAFPKSRAAASAQLTQAQESQGLAGAWAARKAGDVVAMNLLLALLAVQTHDPLQLALASEAPEPLTGTLTQSLQYKSHIHIYFMAFRSYNDAQAFTTTTHHYPDTSVFKAAAQTDDQGNFTVWLAPGYSYVPIWEAPAQGGVDDYYYWSGSIVTVAPFTPSKVGFLLLS